MANRGPDRDNTQFHRSYAPRPTGRFTQRLREYLAPGDEATRKSNRRVGTGLMVGGVPIFVGGGSLGLDAVVNLPNPTVLDSLLPTIPPLLEGYVGVGVALLGGATFVGGYLLRSFNREQ